MTLETFLAGLWAMVKDFLPYVATILSSYATYRLMKSNIKKVNAEAEKTLSESRKTKIESYEDDATAAEIYQRILVEDAISKSETLRSLREDLAIERKARKELEAKVELQNATILHLTGKVKEESEARLKAEETIVDLKTWAEDLVTLLTNNNIQNIPVFKHKGVSNG